MKLMKGCSSGRPLLLSAAIGRWTLAMCRGDRRAPVSPRECGRNGDQNPRARAGGDRLARRGKTGESAGCPALTLESGAFPVVPRHVPRTALLKKAGVLRCSNGDLIAPNGLNDDGWAIVLRQNCLHAARGSRSTAKQGYLAPHHGPDLWYVDGFRTAHVLGLDPVHLRHLDVHQDDFGEVPAVFIH